MLNYQTLMETKYGQRYRDYRAVYTCNALDHPLAFPLELDLDLYDTCNLQCPACHSIHRKRMQKKMDINTLQKIADECAQYQLPAINIGGCGEPLLAPDLVLEALKLFQDAQIMDIFLHTNGHLLTEEIAYRLIENGVTYLCVSLDAYTQEMYQKMRGASLQTVIDNIDQFLQIRGKSPFPHLRVSFLATPINISEKDAFQAYWATKADVVDIQKYVKYDHNQIEELPSSESNMIPISQYTQKRMSIVAPEYLCRSCSNPYVLEAMQQDNTLSNFGSIKNYWSHINAL